MLSLLLVVSLLQAPAAPAQDKTPPAPPAPDSFFKTLIKQVSLDGQARFRFEYRDPVAYTDLPASTRSDDLFLERLRINLKFTVTDDIDVFIQPQDQRVWGQEASVLSDEKNLDLHQGFVEFRNLLGEPVTVKIGRQELSYGDQRLISPLDWSNIARAWDGIKVRYGPGTWWIDGFYTVIKEGNGAGEDQDFFGFYGSYVGVADHEVDLYVLGRSFRDGSFTDERGGVGDLVDGTVGARLKGKAAGFDYTLEGMEQFGHLAKDRIKAYAFAATLGYTFDMDWKPRLGIEFNQASGDNDPADGKHGTFDPLFPFFHYYQGFADIFGWKNARDLMGSLKVAPTDSLSIQVDVHQFWLVQERDAWYNDPGAVIRRDPTGNAGQKIGSEIDLHARVSAGKWVKFWFGWSHFFPGSFVKNTPGTDRSMDWFFFQMTVDF
jgi:alginate export protein